MNRVARLSDFAGDAGMLATHRAYIYSRRMVHGAFCVERAPWIKEHRYWVARREILARCIRMTGRI